MRMSSCHIIFAWSQLQEAQKEGDNKIGTTNKGIGPAIWIRLLVFRIRGDLLDREVFAERLKINLAERIVSLLKCTMQNQSSSMRFSKSTVHMDNKLNNTFT